MPPRGVAEGLNEPFGYLACIDCTPSGAVTVSCVRSEISFVGRNVASLNGSAFVIKLDTDHEVEPCETGKSFTFAARRACAV